ncbi:MAG: Crp/Fnr family transcriptional regulator [Sphaerochaetaceae bacterium]|nr:Crp/Fnr family transcriptional regulator [Sphaerochaetaceae bacterium]
MSASESFSSLFPHLSSLIPSVQFQTYASGRFLVRERDTIDHLFFLMSGEAWVTQNLANGRAHLYQIHSSGDIVGDVEYYLGCEATCSVQCMSEVSVGRIPYRTVETIEKEHPELSKALATALASKLRTSSFAAARNLSYPLIYRFAHYLISTGLAFIPNTRLEEAAELLGSSRRHLRRVISQLEDQGVLRRNGKGITVENEERLQILSSEIDP